MSLMEELLAQFEEEVEGVSEYSRCAKAAKDDPELQKMYTEMAAAELDHARRLQQQLEKRAAEPVEPEQAVIVLQQIRAAQQKDMDEKMAKARACLSMLK